MRTQIMDRSGPYRQHCKFLAACVIVSMSGCLSMSRGDRSPASQGYLVPGPHAAHAFGIPPSDTLGEAVDQRVPEAVRQASADYARIVHARPECTRFFEGNQIYVALFTAFCGDRLGKETDSRPLAAFRSDGVRVAAISWQTVRGVAEVVPFRRL